MITSALASGNKTRGKRGLNLIGSIGTATESYLFLGRSAVYGFGSALKSAEAGLFDAMGQDAIADSSRQYAKKWGDVSRMDFLTAKDLSQEWGNSILYGDYTPQREGERYAEHAGLSDLYSQSRVLAKVEGMLAGAAVAAYGAGTANAPEVARAAGTPYAGPIATFAQQGAWHAVLSSVAKGGIKSFEKEFLKAFLQYQQSTVRTICTEE